MKNDRGYGEEEQASETRREGINYPTGEARLNSCSSRQTIPPRVAIIRRIEYRRPLDPDFAVLVAFYMFA